MVEDFSADHAEFSPSSLGNMERCPGFRNRKDGSTNEAALRGTRIHKALETDTVAELPSKDEIAVAQMCRDYMDAVIQVRGVPFDQDIRESAGKIVIDLSGDLKTFGTPDRILIYGDEAEMFDYKSGYLAVKDATENAQAWAYVIGTFQKFPFLKSIKFHILIPNRDEIFTHTFTPGDLADMKLRLNTIVRNAMEFDWADFKKILAIQHKLNPQPELCEYCENQTDCPALAAKHLKVAAKLGTGLPIPESLQVSKERPDDIAHILRLAPLLEAWAKAQRKRALELSLKDNVDIPGFVRLSRRTDRAIKSIPDAWEALKDKINLHDFLSALGTASIPELEKFFKKQAGKGQKGKAARDMETRLRHAGIWADQGEIYYLKESKS